MPSDSKSPDSIPSEVDAHIRSLLDSARHLTKDDTDQAWSQLEDAHVLAQVWARPHIRVHVAMLRLGFITRDPKEVFGQLIRVVVAGPGSKSGKVPIGNTGRAREPLTTTRPLREDLRELLEL